jgi:predicted transcriptional regulator YheO
MQPSEKSRLLEFVSRLSQALADAVGKNCEVVVHDLRCPEKSIIAIANGHITGRKVGDTLDVLGFQLLKTPPPGDLLNYRTKPKDGKVLRSSSVFLRDENGDVFGALCINLDISELIKVQSWLQETTQDENPNVEESFEHTVDEVLENLIRSATNKSGKDISELTREDKIAIVAQLEANGAFLIRYSGDRVADLLKMSKYTIYNYLDEIRKRQGASEPEDIRPSPKE